MSSRTGANPLIACALERELQPLRSRLGTRADYAVTGLGRRRTTTTLTDYFRKHCPRLMVFSGTAGQLDPKLRMGEVVAPVMWKLEDGRAFYADSRLMEQLHHAGWPHRQSGLTVNRPVLRPQRRLRLWREHSACICDMESAGALEVAAEFEVAAVAVKVIADTAASSLRDFWGSLDDNLNALADSLEQLLFQLDL